ncbi:MAG: hypothetical protein A2464_14660 [Deltaproteobacteria bacterium RIFOXYC2_FULL_48_10]|nr:MAG: hypothetical protein A2464_14660 [Deltaproteobacteria bacterium RIFOXYC2_FULL_48_10]
MQSLKIKKPGQGCSVKYDVLVKNRPIRLLMVLLQKIEKGLKISRQQRFLFKKISPRMCLQPLSPSFTLIFKRLLSTPLPIPGTHAAIISFPDAGDSSAKRISAE